MKKKKKKSEQIKNKNNKKKKKIRKNEKNRKKIEIGWFRGVLGGRLKFMLGPCWGLW